MRALSFLLYFANHGARVEPNEIEAAQAAFPAQCEAAAAAQAAFQAQCEAAAAAQLALAAAREPPSHNRSRHAQYWAII
jgi:hypothetical protein